MEKIVFLTNGQWELVKGVPNHIRYYDGGRGYRLDLTDESGQYTGKHLDNLLNAGFKFAQEDNPHSVKNMINHETGKHEDHILVHFGMNHSDLENNLEQDLNNFKVHKDGHIGVIGKQGALVSRSPEFSASYTNYEKDKDNPGSLLSFWVPRSKVAHMVTPKYRDVEGYHNMTKEQRKKFREDSLNVRNIDDAKGYDFDEDNYDLEAEGKVYTHAKFHNDIVRNAGPEAQALEGSFTRIHPGKYKPATLDEVKASLGQEATNYASTLQPQHAEHLMQVTYPRKLATVIATHNNVKF